MNTLNREFVELVDLVEPPLIDLDQLDRLVTQDEQHTFDGECAVHDGCRRI